MSQMKVDSVEDSCLESLHQRFTNQNMIDQDRFGSQNLAGDDMTKTFEVPHISSSGRHSWLFPSSCRTWTRHFVETRSLLFLGTTGSLFLSKRTPPRPIRTDPTSRSWLYTPIWVAEPLDLGRSTSHGHPLRFGFYFPVHSQIPSTLNVVQSVRKFYPTAPLYLPLGRGTEPRVCPLDA